MPVRIKVTLHVEVELLVPDGWEGVDFENLDCYADASAPVIDNAVVSVIMTDGNGAIVDSDPNVFHAEIEDVEYEKEVLRNA